MRVIMAALAGGVVLFVWGFLSWAVIGWHEMGVLPDEAAVNDAISSTLEASGQAATEPDVYFVPSMPDYKNLEGEALDAAVEDWKNRHNAGPIAMLVYNPEGSEPQPPAMFIKGFIINVLAAGLAALLLSFAGSTIGSYLGRVSFVAALGLFVGIYAEGTMWNWLYFPDSWAMVNFADHLVAWFLAGLPIAALVTGKTPTTSAASA